LSHLRKASKPRNAEAVVSAGGVHLLVHHETYDSGSGNKGECAMLAADLHLRE
jgi:hypothetical protein